MSDIDLWWSHGDEMDYVVLHVGRLERTEVALLRRSNNGKNYFLEIELPNYDLEHVELGDQSSRPFDEQKKRAEAWVRSWFKLAMAPKE